MEELWLTKRKYKNTAALNVYENVDLWLMFGITWNKIMWDASLYNQASIYHQFHLSPKCSYAWVTVYVQVRTFTFSCQVCFLWITTFAWKAANASFRPCFHSTCIYSHYTISVTLHLSQCINKSYILLLSLCLHLVLNSQVCLFLKRGASQTEVDEQGHDPLSIAVQAANADIVTLWVISDLLRPKILSFSPDERVPHKPLDIANQSCLRTVGWNDSFILLSSYLSLSSSPLLQTASSTDERGDARSGASLGSTRSIPQQQPHWAAV